MGNQVDGTGKFSTTWGAGLKLYQTEHVGFRTSVRWTPTYIRSDFDGIWCSPYWAVGCWVVDKANFSRQLEFTGGIIFRF